MLWNTIKQTFVELFAKHLDHVLYRHLPLSPQVPKQVVTSELARSQNAHHGTCQSVRSLHLDLPRKIWKTSLNISFILNAPRKFSAMFYLIFAKSSFREVSLFQLLAQATLEKRNQYKNWKRKKRATNLVIKQNTAPKKSICWNLRESCSPGSEFMLSLRTTYRLFRNNGTESLQ